MTLVHTELARRGYKVMEEPDRWIVNKEMRGEGLALPWVDMNVFRRRYVANALA